jgi:A/G-specific adenine glycosylase
MVSPPKRTAYTLAVPRQSAATDQQQHRQVVRALLSWYQRHRRTLPWRDLPNDDLDHKAYFVLVSEVMLQQTQVQRVVILFKKFIQKFPTMQALSEASNRDVLLEWRGLGYNNRALRLRDAARTVVREHGGHFPHDLQALLAIKGIGPYTAAAVRNFAFGLATPCIDTNVRRILHRVWHGPEMPAGDWRVPDRQLTSLAADLLVSLPRTKHAAADWHAALMDFGSAVCTKRSPRCEICPLKAQCNSAARVPVPAKGVRRSKLEAETGRSIAGRHTPDRLVRGRLTEALRDVPRGLALQKLGPYAAIDWDASAKQVAWLQMILDRLVRDGVITKRGSLYHLG